MERQQRVLIVEDSTTQAMRMQHLLKTAGIETAVANGGQKTLEMLSQDTGWDAILSDIDMPEMDGFELCKRVKQLPAARSIPFIMLVSLKDMRDVVRCLEAGADNMLMKEYEKTYFLPQLASILDSHKKPQSTQPQNFAFEFDGRQYEVNVSSEQLAAILVSTFAMAMHQKAARLPVVGKT